MTEPATGLAGETTVAQIHGRFLKDIEEIAAFLTFAFVGGMVLQRGLVDIASVDSEVAEALSDAKVAAQTFKEDSVLQRFWRELLLTRLVDRFTVFVAEILALILKTKPEIMTGEMVSFADVLAAPSVSAIVQGFAAQRADSLSYGGFKDMRHFLERKVGLNLSIRAEVLAEATAAIAARNAIVHNRGVVNSRYLIETGRRDLKVGELVPLDKMSLDSLTEIAHIIGRATTDKFAPARRS